MILKFLVRLIAQAARAINSFLGQVTEAVTEGVAPEQNAHAVDANVEWGRQWLLTALETLLRGGRVQVTTVDVTMLVIFVASTVLARRMKATRVIVQAWPLRASTTS